MASLMPQGKQQYLDSAGAPLAGGKLYTYAVGTSTPLATYSDQAGTTPNANPVVLDARGEAVIFWAASVGYKAELRDSADALIWTQDNLYAPASPSDTAAFAVVRCADGTVSAPSISFTNETGTGWYRSAASTLSAAISGVIRASLKATGWFVDTIQALTASTTLTLKGNLAAGDSGSDIDVDSVVTRTAGLLLRVLNGGGIRFRVGYDGTLYLDGTTSAVVRATTANVGIELRGNKSAGDSGADVTVNSAATRTAGKLTSFQNNTSEVAYVEYTGKVFGTGLDAGSAIVSNVATPSASTDAVNKAYVDGVYKTADQSESAGSYTNVTDMAFAVEADKAYYFEFILRAESAATTTGLWLNLTGPAASSGNATRTWWDSNSIPDNAKIEGASGSLPLTLAAATGAPATGIVAVDRVTGVIVNGANAGTVQLQFRTEVGTSAVTIKAYSVLNWRKLN